MSGDRRRKDKGQVAPGATGMARDGVAWLGGWLPTARGKGQFGWGWCGGGDSAGRRVSGGGKVSRGPVEHTNRQNQRRRRCVAARNAWHIKVQAGCRRR